MGDGEPVSVAHLLAEPVLVPGYVLGERIGAGGFGEVFRAHHELMGRDVAIKVLHRRYSADPDAIARFVAEGRAVSRISHPGIVNVFDFGTLRDGRQYCVMELIRGTTLRDMLRERTRLPLDEALPILRAIAEAVDAAHGAGIAHRDLKPDNVFVLEGGVIKLIDFGLAKLTSDEAPVTQTGAAFGTPLYMSPEQCRGRRVDARTDAYSFGVLTYHVLTGELPFTGDAIEIALHHLNDQPAPPSQRCDGLGERVDRVVLALLAKDPAERPALLATAIDAIAGDAVLPARPRRSHRARLALAVAATALAGIVVWNRGCVAPVADDECGVAAERLTGVWDPPTRAAVEARFASVPRPDVAGTWRRVSTDLDAYAARWSTQWDEACAADRKTDPLLHVQRLTCLETALLQFRGATRSLAAVDIATFSHGAFADFVPSVTPSLAACTNVAILREQRPPPPPGLRDEVTELAEQFELARTQVHVGSDIDGGLAGLQRVAVRLETLGLSGAREASIRAGYLVSFAIEDRDRNPAARAAIADTIRRAELSRDDTILAGIYSELGRLELATGNDKNMISDALARGEAALLRAGRTGGLAVLRAELEVRAGRLDRAVELLRGDLAQTSHWLQTAAPSSPWARVDTIQARLIDVLARLDRHTDAIDEARKIVASSIQALGDMHSRTSQAHGRLARALARGGRFADALAAADTRVAILDAIQGAPSDIQSAHLWRMSFAERLGRADLVAEARAAAIRVGAAPDAIFHGLYDIGAIELARAELERMATTPSGFSAMAIEDALAGCAFMYGDLAGMKEHAKRVSPNVPEESLANPKWLFGFPAPMASWWLAIDDAVAGRSTEAEARLAKLAFLHASSVPNVAAASYMNDGWVLVALTRWDDAVRAFESNAAGVWSRADRVELGAWLGLSRLEAGDPAGALAPLEECLDAGMELYEGFQFYTPMAELALARALWATDGDKARARYLAGQAREHFARLGPFKEPERQKAIRWLAEHPVP